MTDHSKQKGTRWTIVKTCVAAYAEDNLVLDSGIIGTILRSTMNDLDNKRNRDEVQNTVYFLCYEVTT